jgi:hypothetical protein
MTAPPEVIRADGHSPATCPVCRWLAEVAPGTPCTVPRVPRHASLFAADPKAHGPTILRRAREWAGLPPIEAAAPAAAPAASGPDHAALLTAGVGDWLVIESHLGRARRTALRSVHYATRQRAAIRGLIEANRELPNVAGHVTEWDDFTRTFGFSSAEMMERTTGRSLPDRVADWSIYHVFPRIKDGSWPFTGSSYLRHRLADIGKFDLPDRFLAVHPYSPNDHRIQRDFGGDDWDALLAHIGRIGLPGVVLNTGDDPIPDHPSLVNLANRTTLPESIEILKRAEGFAGIASCLSVLAAQLFPSNRLAIQGYHPHLEKWKAAYYAPHREFSFLGLHMAELLDPARWDADPDEWILVFGAWGDALAQIGHARTRAREAHKPVGAVVYWFDETLSDFVAAQPDFARVWHVLPPSPPHYQAIHDRWFDGRDRLRPAAEWMPDILEGTGIEAGQVDMLPVLADDGKEATPPVFHGASLPAEARAWAADRVGAILGGHARPLILLHPLSVTSTPESDGWPHWEAARTYLKRAEATFVLTGQKPVPGWDDLGPRLVDLSGRTPSMSHVFALAELCDGLICTSNSLSMFSVVADRPAVVCCNRAISWEPDYLFSRWLKRPPNHLVLWDQDVSHFRAAFLSAFPGVRVRCGGCGQKRAAVAAP